MVPNIQKPTDKEQSNIDNLYRQDEKPTDNNNNIDISKQNYNDINSFLTQQTQQNEVPIQDDQEPPAQSKRLFKKNNQTDYHAGDIVNNIIGSNDKSGFQNNKYPREYTGSGEIDLIRDLYDNINKIDQQSQNDAEDFIKNCDNCKLDETYQQNIQKSQDEQKKFAPVKQFKGWSNTLAIPLMRLLENIDSNGEVSSGDYYAFLNGPLLDLKKDLQDQLEKKDSKGKPVTPVEMQMFLKKALEGIEDIENNNGFSFDPTTMRYNFGIIHKNMSDIYYNISVLDQIIIAIYNFFTFTDFFSETAENNLMITELKRDIDNYYDTPFENRQSIINKINERIAKIEYHFSNNYLVSKEARQSFENIKSDLAKAMRTKIDATNIVVDFIKIFGQKAISATNIHLIDKNVYALILDKLANSIKDNCEFSETESKKWAKRILNSEDLDEILEKIQLPENKKKNIDIFFNGKVNDVFTLMMKKFNSVNSYEDAKIKANANLKKVDAISKKTKAITDAISKYISQTNKGIIELRRKYNLLISTGAMLEASNVNKEIVEIKRHMFENIKRATDEVKNSVYEYIDDPNKRNSIVNESKKSFNKEVSDIKKIMEKELFDDRTKKGQKEKVLIPKPGKGNDIEEMQNMLDNMKNIAGFAFSNWEHVKEIVDRIEQQIQTPQEFVSNFNNNTNLFDLIKNRAKIENNVINNMLDRNQRQPPMMPRFFF